MARRKKTTKGVYRLLGGIFCLLSVIGIFRFDPAGLIISSVMAVLFGSLWLPFLITVSIVSIYFMIKGEKPSFFSSRIIGYAFIFISASILLQVNNHYINNPLPDQLNKMILNYNNYFKLNYIESLFLDSGGILGILLSNSSISFVSKNGTLFLSWLLFVIGFFLMLGISLFEVLSSVKTSSKKIKGLTKVEIAKVKKAEEEFDKKPVIENTEPVKVFSTSDYHYNNPTKEKEVKEEAYEVLEIDENSYTLPSINLLTSNQKSNDKVNKDIVNKTIPILEGVFKDFDLIAKVVKVHIGPAVSQYELTVPSGTKLSKITAINKEIALALSAKDVRIEAPIPGKNTIGVEVPNPSISMVGLKEILTMVPSEYKNSKLLACLGLDIMGTPKYMEINKMPHLLVAGATGSGKSVCINTIILSILMRTKPSEVKLVLIDPKKVELAVYNGSPHLKVPVVTDPSKANVVLKKIVAEMEARYELFQASGTKNIAGYNEYCEQHNLKNSNKKQKLPFIVVIVDELADLMMVAGKEVQDSIMRITQMARAAGIHLIVATQRPSTDVITGVIKANIPSRISFSVASAIDSRTILDMMGAEKLLGKGDMLYLPEGENSPIRIQGAFVSDADIKKVVDDTISKQKANYDNSLLDDEKGKVVTDPSEDYDEPLYNDMVDFVINEQKASTSLLQRRFRIGYNRAANAIDLLEKRGIVGPQDGSKPRVVLIKKEI